MAKVNREHKLRERRSRVYRRAGPRRTEKSAGPV